MVVVFNEKGLKLQMEIASYFETAQYFFHAVTLFRINQVFFSVACKHSGSTNDCWSRASSDIHLTFLTSKGNCFLSME